MQERIKEHDRDIRLARTQTFAVSEHTHETGHYPIWNEVKFIDQGHPTTVFSLMLLDAVLGYLEYF